MSSYSTQLHEEQQVVTRLYERLDDLRSSTRLRLDAVRAAGSHGSPTQRTERDSFATMYEDRLAQLRAVEDRLVFGRLDDETGVRRYIGRIGMSSENHEPMLTDWRAEAARPFYEATPAHHGDIVLRRHITLRFRDVVGLEDEVLDMASSEVDRATESGTLTGEGALLTSLGSRRTGRMTDIVATIQAEQDRIIRAPLSGALVVQGGPGTGKTAVALHRAAYLLYTHRRRLASSGVLVVGPSQSFLHYIDQVLPSLGETGVVSRTIGDLIPDIDATAMDTPQAARIKGDSRMASAIANAVSSRERIPAALPTTRVNGVDVSMLASDVEQAVEGARRTRQPHNKARETFIRTMLTTLRNRYAEKVDYSPDQSELSDVETQLALNDAVRHALNLAWLPMTATWLIDQMLAKPAQLRRYAPWLDDDDVAALIRPKGSPFTRSDIPLLDEAMELLGPDPHAAAARRARDSARAEEVSYAKETLAQAGIGSGIVTASMLAEQMSQIDGGTVARRAGADRDWTYGHVVVDEAQELTAMDWRMLLRRCPSRSFTIVGDVAQTAAMGGTRDWNRMMDRLFGPGGWSLKELSINYRNPREVSELSSAFAERSGLYVSTTKAVRAVPLSVSRLVVENRADLERGLSSLVPKLAHEFVGDDGTGRVAIIAPDGWIAGLTSLLDAALRGALPSEETDRLAGQALWDRQIVVCGTDAVKGLEYDAVVVVQPGEIEESAPSRLTAASDLYVAMTRPTQRLVIVRTRDDARALEL
ncbi:ATP-dependent DNA helicase [uncultured Bifidobacterium sp.]|uniref:HelD family protein n=1 Tax=uncultured Bifidobacterium sp. TaxID=165187 RepID=UPI0028DB9354|nr:ATP-dependent DNA helicase [uncultured Bifidobacterium sp.]